MLLMPQSPPIPTHHSSMCTMSLAILPSAPASLAYSQPSNSMSLPSAPSPSKRPRLSLNTNNVQPSVFGKGATSLRLETLSATSPTSRNTFRNAHHKATPATQRPTLTPLTTVVSQPQDELDTPCGSASSSSTSDSTSTSATEAPYKLSYNITSILTNGPIPKPPKRMISFSHIKPMFPAAKKVSFRTPLTEDIKNTKYTMAHADIESSTSTISTLELSPPEDTSTSSESDDTDDSASKKEQIQPKRTSSPKTGEKRDSSDEEDSDSCPATPIAGRAKRHRQWVWTLEPVTQQSESQSEQSEEESKEH